MDIVKIQQFVNIFYLNLMIVFMQHIFFRLCWVAVDICVVSIHYIQMRRTFCGAQIHTKKQQKHTHVCIGPLRTCVSGLESTASRCVLMCSCCTKMLGYIDVAHLRHQVDARSTTTSTHFGELKSHVPNDICKFNSPYENSDGEVSATNVLNEYTRKTYFRHLNCAIAVDLSDCVCFFER